MKSILFVMMTALVGIRGQDAGPFPKLPDQFSVNVTTLENNSDGAPYTYISYWKLDIPGNRSVTQQGPYHDDKTG